MDRHSEVEIKFVIPNPSFVTLEEFQRLVVDLETEGLVKIVRYKSVAGKDIYYTVAGQPVRYREGDGDKEAELTLKKRKSQDSITDRVEVNIPLKRGAAGEVEAFLGHLGASKEFEIFKFSHIFHVTGKTDDTTYEATVVLYDVSSPFPDNNWGFDRYLEVEVESDSHCSPEQAKEVLDLWTGLIQNRLYVKSSPLNKSLYEIYNDRKASSK